MTSAVQRELLLIEDRYVTRSCTSSILVDIDTVAQQYITDFLFKNGTAIKSTGNGDCFFNAISIILCGNESMSAELRYKCCLEMVSNDEKIQQYKDRAALLCVSPDYDEAVLKCARLGGYSSAWTIIAMSNVTKRKIESLYPLVNGTQDLATRTLNCTFLPSSGTLDETTMKIFWTNTSPFNPDSKKKRTWTPNHFVPFIDDRKLLATDFHMSKKIKTSTPESTQPTLFIPKHTTSTTRNIKWKMQRKRSRPLSPIHRVEKEVQLNNRFQSLSDSEESQASGTDCELLKDSTSGRKKPTSGVPKHTTSKTRNCELEKQRKRSREEKDIHPNKRFQSLSDSDESLQASDTDCEVLEDSTPGWKKPTSSVPRHTTSKTRNCKWKTQRKRSRPMSPIQSVEKEVQFYNRFHSLSDSEESQASDSDCELLEDSTTRWKKPTSSVPKHTTSTTRKNKRKTQRRRSREEQESWLPSPIHGVKKEVQHDNRFPSPTNNDESHDLYTDGKVREDKHVMSVSSESSSKDIPVCEQLPNPGNFLTSDELLAILENTHNPLHAIPAGDKTNSYCVIDNSVNNRKRHDNLRSAFVDDCGIWDTKTGNTVNFHLMLTKENRLKGITLKNGVFCIERRVNKSGRNSKIWEQLEVQPTEQNLFQIHRYYTKHKGNHSFKKRVTCFDTVPPKFQEKIHYAIIEYCGKFNEVVMAHGNSKDKNENYIRTDPAIIQKAYELSKEKKTYEVIEQMCENDSFQAPKNSKQIRNKKYRETSKEAPLKPINVADEMYQVLCSIQTSDFIQQIIFTNKKRPITILYKADQIEDMKANCIGEGGSIIGIDKTFNLGSCFVSALTYKQKAVIQRETNDHPIMLGPMMLHYDSDYETYFSFLSLIKQKTGATDIIIGSDEEKAITKAIRNVFPSATQLLCTKHMKDNIRRNLQDKIGCSKEDREKIVKAIFGPQGIATNSNDSINLDTNLNNLQPFFNKYPSFETYFKRKIQQNLIHHVIQPINNSVIQELWTNNNTESMNNRMKMQCN